VSSVTLRSMIYTKDRFSEAELAESLLL